MKEKFNISFSGGRTSAYMTKYLLDNFSDEYDFIVTFANTGLEHEKTLDFIHKCDLYFGFKTVWLEPIITPGSGKATTHKIVSYDTVTRGSSLFEKMIEKYGIPSKTHPHCTRELKLRPMESYLRSLGENPRRIKTALGIRADEPRRFSKGGASNIVMPLVDWIPTDKTDVLMWWEKQAFNLEIEEFEGNCRGCFKKSFKKLFKTLDTDPGALDFHIYMEYLHGQTNNRPGFPDRVFFRGGLSGLQVHRMYAEDRGSDNPILTVQDGGCSESCEIY